MVAGRPRQQGGRLEGNERERCAREWSGWPPALFPTCGVVLGGLMARPGCAPGMSATDRVPCGRQAGAPGPAAAAAPAAAPFPATAVWEPPRGPPLCHMSFGEAGRPSGVPRPTGKRQWRPGQHCQRRCEQGCGPCWLTCCAQEAQNWCSAPLSEHRRVSKAAPAFHARRAASLCAARQNRPPSLSKFEHCDFTHTGCLAWLKTCCIVGHVRKHVGKQIMVGGTWPRWRWGFQASNLFSQACAAPLQARSRRDARQW